LNSHYRRVARLSQSEEPSAFWQPRYHDFNVYSQKKHIEKLRYIHRNPVKRGLVTSPELWRWSSYRFYRYGEIGSVKIGE
jgi:REP-associated tyrosine transposase